MGDESVRRLSQTLVLDPASNRVLLGLHKTGPFVGNYTGLIGYVHDSEACEAAARRIALELVDVVLGPLELGAVFRFTTQSTDPADEYEFLCTEFTGRPIETASMTPAWFSLEQIPYNQMPADDGLWYPGFLRGQRLTGSFDFVRGKNELLSHQLEVVSELPALVPHGSSAAVDGIDSRGDE